MVQFILHDNEKKYMSLPFVADFRLQGQLDALSTKDFETLKGLKREINTLFRKWSLRNNPENGGDAVIFNNVRDTKTEIFKQIDLQEQKRWTLNLVKGGQEQKARHASRLASACRRKLLQDRIIDHSKKNQALVRLTARIVRSFNESSEAVETAFSDLRNFGLDDSTPISRVLDNDLNVSVLICGLENVLFQILDRLGGGQRDTMHDGVKGTPNNHILTSIETYGRVVCTINEGFQLANVNQECQVLQKEIKELLEKNEGLDVSLQETQRDLAAVTSAHIDVQSQLIQKEEELAKIKDFLSTYKGESETDLISRIRAFFKNLKLGTECDNLRREKDEIRRKLESQLREVNDEKIREIDSIKCKFDSQIQDREDTIKQLQQSLDEQADSTNVKLQVQKAQYDSSVQVLAEKLKTIVNDIRAMNELLLCRESDRPISEDVRGGNEEAVQVALLSVILDRMGCFGTNVERMVLEFQEHTGKKMKHEEVYTSMLYVGKAYCSDRLCSFSGIGSSLSPYHPFYVACQSNGSLGLQASQRVKE